MDLMLTDGTVARNVSVMEYEQLKARGHVGNPAVSAAGTGTSAAVVKDAYFATHCWMCGTELTDANRADIIYASNPPKYACKKCAKV